MAGRQESSCEDQHSTPTCSRQDSQLSRVTLDSLQVCCCHNCSALHWVAAPQDSSALFLALLPCQALLQLTVVQSTLCLARIQVGLLSSGWWSAAGTAAAPWDHRIPYSSIAALDYDTPGTLCNPRKQPQLESSDVFLLIAKGCSHNNCVLLLLLLLTGVAW